MIINRSRTIGTRLVLLRDYLYSHADANHAVSIKDMMIHLANCGFEVAIKTVYSDLHALQFDFGLDLEYCEKLKGYILRNPPFEPYELRLLIDSVQASKFITQTKAQQITEKIIKQFGNEKTRAELNRQAFVSTRVRSMNESVVREADKLYAAIRANCKIGFYYFHYTPQKEKKYSKQGDQYIVSPFALLWSDGNLYLYAHDGAGFRYFRVDRMEHITNPLPARREGIEQYQAKNVSRPKAKVFQMFSGKEYNVRMQFRKELVDAVFDQFGREIMLIPEGDEHFTITAPVEVSPPFYAWISSFGRRAKILAPAEAVEGMKEFLERASDMYKDDGNT